MDKTYLTIAKDGHIVTSVSGDLIIVNYDTTGQTIIYRNKDVVAVIPSDFIVITKD